jgi:hypothetical protein
MAAIIEGDPLGKRIARAHFQTRRQHDTFLLASRHQAEKGAYRDLESQPAPLTEDSAIKQTNQLLAQGRMAPFFRSHARKR